MPRQIARLIDACTRTPAWAVHFHTDDPDGACFDARCGLAPLTVSDRPRFTPTVPGPPAGRPQPARARRSAPVAGRPLTAAS
jgi:hypothetical protein